MDFQEALDRLGAFVRDHLTTRTVYGDPVELNGRTVVPVSRVLVAGGGGSGGGKHPDGKDAGIGGGGTVQVIPIGFLQEKDGEVVFTAIEAPNALPTLTAGTVNAMIDGVTGFAAKFLPGPRRR